MIPPESRRQTITMAQVKLTWTGGDQVVCHDLIEADLSALVYPGDTVSVPSELAERLRAGSAGWKLAKAPAKPRKPRATKKTAAPEQQEGDGS